MRRNLILGCLVLGLLATGFLARPSTALTWTQTSQADFLAGQRSNVDILPTGDLVLTSSPSWAREGIVLDVGAPGSADDVLARTPSLLKDGSTYKMWYSGQDASPRNRILYADSPDGLTWTKRGIVLDVLQPPWNFDSVVGPSVRKEGSTYKMWFSGGFWTTPLTGNVYYAESADGVAWNVIGLALGVGPGGAWDSQSVGYADVVQDGAGRYWMYYSGYESPSGAPLRIGAASSTDGRTFTRTGADPVLGVSPTGSWDSSNVVDPFVAPGSPWRMWYTGNYGATAGIGVATATDPNNWSRSSGSPEFVSGPPGSWDGASVVSCAVLFDGANTFLYYSGGDGSNVRIGRARLNPGYVSSGSLESRVLDAGSAGTVWRTLQSSAIVNASSAVTLWTRSGDTAIPDASWSAWAGPLALGTASIASPRARYMQVRVELASSSSYSTPVFNDFTVVYDANTVSTSTPISPTGAVWVNVSRPPLSWSYADPEGDPQGGYRVQVSGRSDFATIVADSSPVLSGASSWVPPALAEGTFYWRVQTMDTFGRWGAFSSTASARIDTAPPVTTGAATPVLGIVGNRDWIPDGALLTLTATDIGSGISTIHISIDGSDALYSSAVPLTGHGPHSIRYWADDVALNTGPRGTLDVLIDGAPAATNRQPANQAWRTAPPSLGWDFSDPDGDPAAGFEVQVASDSSFATIVAGSGATNSTRTAWQAPTLADGTYHWRVRVQDVLSVWSPWSASTAVRIDATAPVAEARHGGVAVSSRNITIPVGDRIELSGSDSGSGIARVEYSLDGGTWTAYASPVSIDSSGKHVLAFRAIDNAGNVGAVTLLAIDVSAPNVTPPLNWTPVVALVAAIVFALAGAAIVRQRRGAGLSAGLSWMLLSGPATIVEAVIAVYSLVTGELSMPPLLGGGLIAVVAVAVGGAVALVIGGKALGARGAPPA